MNRNGYLFVTFSASVLIVTLASVVFHDIIQSCRLRIQAERILYAARDYLGENRVLRSQSEADEMTALRDIAACYEMSVNYGKTGRKRNPPSELLDRNTLA